MVGVDLFKSLLWVVLNLETRARNVAGYHVNTFATT